MIQLPEEYITRTFDDIAYLKERSESQSSVYPCHIKQVDSWIDGGFAPGTMTILAARPNFGKCLCKGTKVIMYDGTDKAVEDVVIGDLLMGTDSTPRKVLSLCRGRSMMYIINQSRGMSYRVNENHILSLRRSKNENKYIRGEIIDIPLTEVLQKGSGFFSRWRGYKVAIELSEKEQPIEPYFLGIWLGDGKSDGSEIYTVDFEVIDYIKEYAIRCGGRYAEGKDTNKSCKSHSIRNCILSKLRDIEVLKNKHIPDNYLYGSLEQRKQLLAGLIDSDGYLNPATSSGSYEITQKIEVLAKQIVRLCNSLGFYTHIAYEYKTCQNGGCGYYYRITFNTGGTELPLKVERRKPTKKNKSCGFGMTTISIEKDCVDDYYGFTIDGDQRFLLEDFTVTHNSAIIQQMCRGLLRSPDTILISLALDDNVPTWWSRLLASVARIPIGHVMQSQKRTEDEDKKFTQTLELIKPFLSRIMVLGASDIASSLEKAKEIIADVFTKVYESSGNRPQLIIPIDSPRNLDFSHISGLASNPAAQTEYAGRRVKDLLDMVVNGVRVDPIVICTDHLKKMMLGSLHRPSADDLKDSIGPQYDGNLIMMLWNDLCFSKTVSGKETFLFFKRDDLEKDLVSGDYPYDPIVELRLSKNKMGRMNYNLGSGVALFKFYQEQSRMEAIEDAEEYRKYASFI